jgi:osmotically-inducible protein OsmY
MLKSAFAFLFGLVTGVALVYVMDGPLDLSILQQEAGKVAQEAGRGAKNLRLEASVKAALALHRDFSLLGGIQVDAQQGEITLAGAVSTDDQRKLAELIARGVDGVDEVVNEIEVVDDA